MNEKHEKIIKQHKGIVVKIVNDNTVKVEVETKAPHPLYTKITKSHKRYLVHSTSKDVKVGDKVAIEECRPISKKKYFKLVKEIVK